MNTPSEGYFADELRAALAELDASGGDIQVTVMLPWQEAKTFSLSKPREPVGVIPKANDLVARMKVQA